MKVIFEMYMFSWIFKKLELLENMYNVKKSTFTVYKLTTHPKRGEGSIGGREYFCCNSPLLSIYENYCIINACMKKVG